MPHDDSADLLFKDLSKEFEAHEICIEYVVKLTFENEANLKKLKIIEKSTARVMIVLGKFLLHYGSLQRFEILLQNITLLTDDSWLWADFVGPKFCQVINGSLLISPRESHVPGLEKFLNVINVNNRPHDPILQDIMYFYRFCAIPDITKLLLFQETYDLPLRDCNWENYPITSLFADFNYSTYGNVRDSVYLLAQAVQHLHDSSGQTGDQSIMFSYKDKVRIK